MKQKQLSVSHLREERSLLSLLLQAVSHQSLHGFWTVAAHLAEVRGQVTSTHHEYDLREEKISVIIIFYLNCKLGCWY